MINLPIKSTDDSARATKLFFERYGQRTVVFNPNDVYSTLGFFQYKGFQDDAAILTGLAILEQAKKENRSVNELLDLLKTLNGVQLSVIISKILNKDRSATSSLGFKANISGATSVLRNILP